jgi:hypothetical protein
LEESGFYDRCGAFPGVGRGREHGDFQHRERGVVAFASVCPSGPSGEDRRQPGGERPQHLELLDVSSHYFSMLGTSAHIGRVFGPGDEAQGSRKRP